MYTACYMVYGSVVTSDHDTYEAARDNLINMADNGKCSEVGIYDHNTGVFVIINWLYSDLTKQDINEMYPTLDIQHLLFIDKYGT